MLSATGRFSTAQIVKKLQAAKHARCRGKNLEGVFQSLQIAKSTYYRWLKQFAGLTTDWAERLIQREKAQERIWNLELANQGLRRVIKNLRRKEAALDFRIERLQREHRKSIQNTSLRLQSLLINNRDLRKREREILLFMLRFTLGYIPFGDFKRKCKRNLSTEDLHVLYSCAVNLLRRKRIHSLIVVFHLYGVPRNLIADVLHVHQGTVNKVIRIYRQSQVKGMFSPRKEIKKFDEPKYKDAVFAILHSPPKDHGFNRTSWRRRDIHTAMTRLGMPLGKNYINRIIKGAGYRFLKARKVLTSNDPRYREKPSVVRETSSRRVRENYAAFRTGVPGKFTAYVSPTRLGWSCNRDCRQLEFAHEIESARCEVLVGYVFYSDFRLREEGGVAG